MVVYKKCNSERTELPATFNKTTPHSSVRPDRPCVTLLTQAIVPLNHDMYIDVHKACWCKFNEIQQQTIFNRVPLLVCETLIWAINIWLRFGRKWTGPVIHVSVVNISDQRGAGGDNKPNLCWCCAINYLWRLLVIVSFILPSQRL